MIPIRMHDTTRRRFVPNTAIRGQLQVLEELDPENQASGFETSASRGRDWKAAAGGGVPGLKVRTLGRTTRRMISTPCELHRRSLIDSELNSFGSLVPGGIRLNAKDCKRTNASGRSLIRFTLADCDVKIILPRQTRTSPSIPTSTWMTLSTTGNLDAILAEFLRQIDVDDNLAMPGMLRKSQNAIVQYPKCEFAGIPALATLRK